MARTKLKHGEFELFTAFIIPVGVNLHCMQIDKQCLLVRWPTL